MREERSTGRNEASAIFSLNLTRFGGIFPQSLSLPDPHGMSIPKTAPHRYLIVSDFHLTTGQDAVTSQWSDTEDFFWDTEFAEFLSHYTDGTPTTLIINGDLVDFLQILDIPDPGECSEFGIAPEEINRKYGLRCTEAAAGYQIARVIRGHISLFQALALFVAHGNTLIFVNGNHDIQLFWRQVQANIMHAFRSICRDKELPFDEHRVSFHPWCYFVPGLLFAEHGNQYESTTAFRNPFMPLLPVDLLDGRKKQLDLDLSGFLVRYVTNRVEPINPLADNVRPLSEYYTFLWKTHPWVALRTFASTAVLIHRIFRKRRLWSDKTIRRRYADICRENVSAMAMEAHRFSDGTPEDHARITALFQRIRTRYHERPAWERKLWPFLRKRRNVLPNMSHVLRSRAGKIASLLGTPYVVFGHSHIPDTAALSNGGRYFNTGTWIPTFTSAKPDTPDELQFTFFRLENAEGALFRWVPERHNPEPVTFH
jgi:UDP-2,3-diacylglucosamine pyrophosphatase LpxH